MNYLRNILIKILHRIGLYKPVRWIVTRSFSSAWRLYGFLTQREKRKLRIYLDRQSVYKLHLGCGLNYLDGWFNTDSVPNNKRVRLDVSKDFPFSDNIFDYAFSEHMIEHLPYMTGKKMLSECFRVLKPGGTIRLATPDLQFLIDLYQDDQKKIHKNYIAWNSEMFIGNRAPHDAISVLNNYVRDWGHKYIYDVSALCKIMESLGFTNINELELGASSHKDLQNLENKSRHPDGFLALESLVLEATKPAP